MVQNLGSICLHRCWINKIVFKCRSGFLQKRFLRNKHSWRRKNRRKTYIRSYLVQLQTKVPSWPDPIAEDLPGQVLKIASDDNFKDGNSLLFWIYFSFKPFRIPLSTTYEYVFHLFYSAPLRTVWVSPLYNPSWGTWGKKTNL